MAAEFLEQMGARIRERRDFLRLSRAEVARRMPGKVNENQVYRWEKGLHQPNPDTLQALAAALECDVAQFMSGPPTTDETPDLFEGNGHEGLSVEDQLMLLTAAVRSVDTQVRLFRAEAAARDAEVLRQIAALRRSSQDPPNEQPQ